VKYISFLGAVAAIGFIAGCSKSDNTASNDTDTSATARASRDDSSALNPTSRETNSPNRLYSSDTNSANYRDADNTGRNQRDRSGDTLTAGDQSNNETDRDLTRRIRRALTTNDQFSADAKNIKIITTEGKVTLRGPVESAQERQAIVSTAQSVAGNAQIDNQLEVKANNQ
jgi:osmotically-inducible protein OsmY